MEIRILKLGLLDRYFNTIDGCIAYCKGFIKMQKYDAVYFEYYSSKYIVV